MNLYTGHPSQIRGAEEHTLTSGKGRGMRLLEVRNGKGLEFTVSEDRCCDISRISFMGINMGYFSPSGYVAPSYYDNRNDEFLKSFTAGFFTTCGLNSVGTPGEDEGVFYPLHGNISNTPAEQISWEETNSGIEIKARIRDASLFGTQFVIDRRYFAPFDSNEIVLKDEITNIGSKKSGLMLLYHCNMGYPLLTENSEVIIPNNGVKPRNAHAAEGIDNALKMEKPQADFEEQCYYYNIKEENGMGKAGIYSPDASRGLIMMFGKDTLDNFTQWKMMGQGEYVLGLEPGNCTPDGRKENREQKILKYLKPGEKYKTVLSFRFFDNHHDFGRNFK